MKLQRRHIPWAMAAGRALLGPIVILGERCNWSGLALASLVITALGSDIFDGVLARRWNCDTAGVRLFDTMADTIFYVCVAAALWIGQPRLWHENALLLGILLSLEALRFIVDLPRFGKPASYHTYLAKTWGLVMAIAVVLTFASGAPSRLVPVTLVLGIAADAEGLAMSAVLPAWRKDVKTLAAALRLRRQILDPHLQSAAGRPRVIALLGTTLLVVLFASGSLLAIEPNHAVYIGGSAAVAPDTIGTLDTTAPAALVFRFTKPDHTAGEVAINYASIKTVQPTNEVMHHLGVAPAIAVGLLAARKHRYFITVTWNDTAGVAQVVQIEVSRRDQNALVAVIRARMPHPCQPAARACGTSVFPIQPTPVTNRFSHTEQP